MISKRSNLIRRALRLRSAALKASDPLMCALLLRQANACLLKSERLDAILPVNPVRDCRAAIIEGPYRAMARASRFAGIED